MSRKLATILFCLMVVMVPAAMADSVMDSINAGLDPVCCAWGPNEVGWYYTPGSSYSLTAIQTRFFADPSLNARNITLEVYDGHPVYDSGTLLRAATFFGTPTNTWEGGSFAALALTAGHNYFIGFRDVLQMGPNTTYFGDASTIYYSGGFYSGANFENFTNGYNPIMQFYGSQVPEPGSLILLGSGLLGLARKLRRK